MHTVHAHELVVEVRRVDIEVVTTHDLPMVVELVQAPLPIQEDVEPDLVLVSAMFIYFNMELALVLAGDITRRQFEY